MGLEFGSRILPHFKRLLEYANAGRRSFHGLVKEVESRVAASQSVKVSPLHHVNYVPRALLCPSKVTVLDLASGDCQCQSDRADAPTWSCNLKCRTCGCPDAAKMYVCKHLRAAAKLLGGPEKYERISASCVGIVAYNANFRWGIKPTTLYIYEMGDEPVENNLCTIIPLEEVYQLTCAWLKAAKELLEDARNDDEGPELNPPDCPSYDRSSPNSDTGKMIGPYRFRHEHLGPNAIADSGILSDGTIDISNGGEILMSFCFAMTLMILTVSLDFDERRLGKKEEVVDLLSTIEKLLSATGWDPYLCDVASRQLQRTVASLSSPVTSRKLCPRFPGSNTKNTSTPASRETDPEEMQQLVPFLTCGPKKRLRPKPDLEGSSQVASQIVEHHRNVKERVSASRLAKLLTNTINAYIKRREKRRS